jgi:hypothetical protein
MLEPAPTSALFAGLLENDSPLTSPKARPPSLSHLSVALSSSPITLEKYRLRVSSFAPNFPSIPWENSFIGDIGCRMTVPPCAILTLAFAFQAPVVRRLAHRVLDCALCALAER